MISVKSLSKRFRNIIAVDNISFNAPPGKIFGLLGPNGAGKTTTINMIVGITVPDSGAVVIDNGGDASSPAVRRKIGNAPQALAIYDDLSAEENLRFFGKLYNLRGKILNDRTDWALELAGLTERKDGRVNTFSGGMKRRLNLACSLIHDPPIVLLDEPTVGVDPQSRNMIFEKIEALKASGRTIVYTTHYMEEAQRLCDTVAIIDHGKILDIGTVEELLNRHGETSIIEGEIIRPEIIPDNLGGAIEGNHIRLESQRPLEDVARLTSQGIKFQTLHVLRPDLESVFLKLTGRRLRN
jgi:ABC-2 type transport system ATP-binding protein